MVGIIAATWLLSGVLLMFLLIRRGRRLVSILEKEEPEIYERHGRPQPGFFESSRRRRFSQFLAQREYLNINVGELADQFERYRRDENRLLASLLGTLAFVGGLIFWASRGT